MQNAGMLALGLDWRYLAFNVHPDDLEEAIQGAQQMRFVGLNLTVPHKRLALDLVDSLDASAEEWGAVNTIRFEGLDSQGAWVPMGHTDADAFRELRSVGFNTDADAILCACQEELKTVFSQLEVLLVGVGGAGRVAALKLASAGVKRLHLMNRTISRAEGVQAEIKARYPSCRVEVGYPQVEVDLLVNGTSVGLNPSDPLPLDLDKVRFSRDASVYDMIYQPAETRLLAQARAAGCRVANGLGMLLYQGARALEIWTEGEVPVGAMREALESHIYGRTEGKRKGSS